MDKISPKDSHFPLNYLLYLKKLFKGFSNLTLGVSDFDLTGEISGFLPNFIQSEF